MSKIKVYLQKSKDVSMFDTILCKSLRVFGYSNKAIETLERRNKVFKYIKRKYGDFPIVKTISSDGTEFNTIWICWLQGEENAPDLVKKCISSVRKYYSDKKITIVDSDNFQTFVSLPDYIIRKWKGGLISNTHFSDILRTALMVEHGGIWMDATVYLTGRIPDIYFKKDLFLFSHMMPDDITIRFNSWFIISRKGEKHMTSVLEVLYRYWKDEYKVREYFLWHLIATEVFEKYGDAVEIYTIPDIIPELLSFNINNQFSQEYWDYVTKLTSIHKLSNKYQLIEGSTYYNHILSSED